MSEIILTGRKAQIKKEQNKQNIIYIFRKVESTRNFMLNYYMTGEIFSYGPHLLTFPKSLGTGESVHCLHVNIRQYLPHVNRISQSRIH